MPFYGVYDFAGATGLTNAVLMRDRFLAPKIVQRTWEDDPEVFEHGSPILRITAGRARLLRAPRRRATPWSTSSRPGCSSPRCATPPSTASRTPSSPAPSTPSTSSRRSAPSTSCGPSSATSSGTAPADDAAGGDGALTTAVATGCTVTRASRRTCSPWPGRRAGSCRDDEGLALHRLARRAAPPRPGARGRHLLRQVRDLPRRGGARRRRRRLHRRPPPRLGGEPGRLGAPRPVAGRPGDRSHGHAAVLPPDHRGGRARGRRRRGRRRRPRPSPRTGAPRSRCSSSTAGTATSRRTPTTRLGAHG